MRPQEARRALQEREGTPSAARQAPRASGGARTLEALTGALASMTPPEPPRASWAIRPRGLPMGKTPHARCDPPVLKVRVTRPFWGNLPVLSPF